MSHENDNLESLCESAREMNRDREKKLKSVIAILGSIVDQRLFDLFIHSEYSDLGEWLRHRCDRGVAQFASSDTLEVDPYIQSVFDIAIDSSDFEVIRTHIAKSESEKLKQYGFSCIFNECGFYIVENT